MADSRTLKRGYNFFNIRARIKDIEYLLRYYAIYPAGYLGATTGDNNDVRALNCVEHRPNRTVAPHPSLAWVNAEKGRDEYDTTDLRFIDHRLAGEPTGLPMFVTAKSFFYDALVEFGKNTALGERVSVAQMAAACCAATPGNTFSFTAAPPCMTDADHTEMLRLYGRASTRSQIHWCV